MVTDSISDGRLRLVYPDVATRWKRARQDLWNLFSRQVRVAQGLRTFAQQQAIWQQGRVLAHGIWIPADPIHHTGIVTWAEPGHSWHEFGAAIDSNVIGPDLWCEKDADHGAHWWSEYARIGKAHGFVAGFDWEGKKQDRPHLEMTYGLELSELRAIYAHGGLQGVWAKFDQIRGVPIGQEWGHPLTATRLTDPRIILA